MTDSAESIETIAVLGAGTMGMGIAHVGALAGFQTRLFDVSAEQLERAQATTARRLNKGVDLGKVTPEARDAALERIDLQGSLEAAIDGVDLVIEAAPEKLDLKLDLFGTCDRYCPEHTILATNTSSMSVTEIAASTQRPERCIGMHFFNPVHLMKLIELVRGLETSEETIAVAEAVSARMGKESVVIKDYAGFATSRINAMIGNEAFYMLEAGVGTARDIDKALKLGLNHPMGPFEMIDLVGLDTRLSILNYLHAKLGEKYRPCPLIEQYVKAGRLGKKVGRGVYDYTD
ncbi:MAG TPA: 3-hydroxyacyl-CoA dehydrogenase [Deltaproteobacteria bacterium]|nr:3-hydroxybutyryl-CoA dehydrogenase [Deltaproteobacteria bacterium]HCP47603.1 3-hydroxyacyl-CoA dehydrogenase [Deltaproteobacteria bacterium]